MAFLNLPAVGWAEAVGIGKETTYGTAVSPTVWFRCLSFGLKKTDMREPQGAPLGVPIGMQVTASGIARATPKAPVCEGTIVFLLEMDDVGFILEQMFGTGSAGSAIDTSAIPHTFQIPVAVPSTMPASFTIVRNSSIQDKRFFGCVARSFEISAANNTTILLSVDFVARDMDTTTASVGSMSTAPFAEFYAAAIRYDMLGTEPDSSDNLTGAEAQKSWSLRVTRPVLAEPAGGDDTIGIREPVQNDVYSAVLTVTKDWASQTFHDIMFASSTEDRTKDIAAYMNGVELAGASTEPYSILARMPAGVFQGDGDEYGGGAGIVPETLSVHAAFDGTNSPLIITLTNKTASGSYSS